MHTSLVQQFRRKLDQLETEIEAYSHEADLWKVAGTITNSGGNLAIHLVGNLNHFIGHGLGNTGYVRNRPAEFEDRHIPVAELVQRIDATRHMIASVLPAVDLEAPYPAAIREGMGTNGNFLLHLLGHLAYHLGQINYHRRIIGA
jgi:hypothetical protein